MTRERGCQWCASLGREDTPSQTADCVTHTSTPKTVIAGAANTAAITLRALFYHALRNPQVYKSLEREVRETFDLSAGKPVSHATAKNLPYLDALIKETLRYHPAVSMIMERIVPAAGLTLPQGKLVPGGCHVGMNPYVVGRNKKIFGEDADTFRSERWLRRDGETDAGFEERMKLYGSATLVFGGGSRICLGRNLSLTPVKVYKVVPTVVATFDVELEDQNEEWWTSARWFYRNKGVVCRLRARGVNRMGVSFSFLPLPLPPIQMPPSRCNILIKSRACGSVGRAFA